MTFVVDLVDVNPFGFVKDYLRFANLGRSIGNDGARKCLAQSQGPSSSSSSSTKKPPIIWGTTKRR